MVTSVFKSFAFILLCCSLPAAAISSLVSQVDKNPALAGEAITLVVSADARLNADALNYRVLEQDFRVMAPSVSQSTQIINGQSSQSTRWTLTLFPLSTGNFTIPAFDINGVRSNAIALTVLPQPNQKDTPKELFVNVTLSDSPAIYVQQMLYYDVVIYFSGDLQRGNLTEPQLEGAEIQRVGQDTEGTELVNGNRYRTITRRYSMIPQRSGNFVIAPPTFTGEIIERDNSRFNYYARSKTVMEEAEPISIEVLAQPPEFSSNWLVAGLVTLTEEWQPAQAELVVGEPVTRIITLSAVDVAPSQLPELDQKLPSQLRLYAEQPQSKGAERSGRQVAQKIFTTAIIANSAGELRLPEVRLPWWNSQTNQPDVALLPARTITVQAPAGSPVIAPPVVASPGAADAALQVSPWQWNYTSSLLVLAWLASLIMLTLWRKQPTTTATIPPAAKPKDTVTHKQLAQACQSGDAAAASNLLLRWGEQQFHCAIHSLGQLITHLDDAALITQLRQLEQHLYRPSNTTWQGESLYLCWRQWRAPTHHSDKAPLAPLYPK